MPSIAIVGAGPAGLSLARLLLVKARNENISDLKLSIFEHDASAKAQWAQGGTLDLHTTTGIAALKEAEMWEDILPHMRYDGEELIMADMNATEMVHLKSAPTSPSSNSGNERPEVDREVLKDALLKAVEDILGDQAITWGKHLLSADAETGILKFKDGSEAGPFDLVVGADGAWSKVRNVLTDVKPSYSGICGFEVWVDEEHSGEHWDTFINFVGKGSYFSYSNQQSFMVQRMEDGTMKAAMWVTKESTWPKDLAERCGDDEAKLREAILHEFSDWDEQMKQVIRCSYHFRQWPLWELPVGHSWDHKKGFTLVGDSAHLMTPFAGEGVNAALKDCLELARCIISASKGEQTLDEAVQEFEQDMFPRNAQVQGKTAHNKTLMFRADAPVGFLSTAPEMFAADIGYDTTKGWVWWALIPAKKLAFAYFWCVSRYGYIRRCIRRT